MPAIKRKSADCTSICDAPALRRRADVLRTYLRPSIRIFPKKTKSEPPIGASKLGGMPDLLADFPWPTHRWGIPRIAPGCRRCDPDELLVPPDGIVHLSFIAQINLAEVRPFDLDKILPREGLLLFFFDPGIDESRVVIHKQSGERFRQVASFTHDRWQVIHLPGDPSRLSRRRTPPPFPPRELREFPVWRMSFHTEMSLPPCDSSIVGRTAETGRFKFSPEERHAYGELLYSKRASTNLFQLLGYADQWSFTADESSYGQFRNELFPRLHDVKQLSPSEWLREVESMRLLLQMGVVPNWNETWMREGRLYFFARQQELKRGDFSKTWGTTL